MTKGTQSFGKKHNKSHEPCKRCGRRSFHCQKKRCGACGYPDAKMHNWGKKAYKRKCTGTGRTKHLRLINRRFRNGFQEGGVMKSKKELAEKKVAKKEKYEAKSKA